MSQFKIYLLNNYLIVECDNPVYEKQVMAGDVRIQPTSEDPLVFDFFNFDNENTKWNTIRLSDMVDEGDTPYTLETWTEFYTTNTGFNPAGGGSPATEKKGIATVLQEPGEQVVLFNHGLPGANWVQLQYSDPELGSIYLADVEILGSEVQIVSDTSFPVGTYTIFYHVAIVS